MSNLSVTHKDFWGMPFFMLVDLLKRSSASKAELTRKEILTNMRHNKEIRGWI